MRTRTPKPETATVGTVGTGTSRPAGARATMAERIAAVDWAETPLGPSPTWPPGLDAAVSLCAASPVPMVLCWGSACTIFFNDAAIPVVGAGRAMGGSLDAWGPADVASLLRALHDRVVEGGTAATNEDRLLLVNRRGFPEETYFTAAASPIFDADGTPGGTLTALFETTEKVIAERRSKLLRALTMRTANAQSAFQACAAAVEVLRSDAADVPACLVYADDERGSLLLAGAYGVEGARDLAPPKTSVNAPGKWPLSSASQHPDGLLVESALGPAVVIPLPRAAEDRAFGFLIAVLSKRLAYDEAYARFLRLAAAEIAGGAAHAHAHEERDRLQEFLAMLAHELRNPLAPIRTALSLLEGRIGDDERARQLLGTLERQSDNLTRLVDDLLDVSRITRGLIELKKEPVDLSSIVERALEAVRPAMEAKQLDVAMTKPMRPVRLEADPVRLEQIVLNLVGNAAKYTNKKGHIRVSVSSSHGVAEVRVKDDGVGISAEMLPRVFDLFQQAQRSLDRSQGGLGIGLTIVKNLVLLHGGTVEAHSEGPGTGSEFIVRLPAEETEHVAAAPAPAPAADPSAGGRRVLVVDDNIDAADTLADLTHEWGHEVRSAHSGPEALKVASEMKPDVVLLDIGLPEMDGYEVARRIRANPALDATYLVALTGYGQQRDRDRAAEAGFDHHLVKPVDIDALEVLLRTARRVSQPAQGETIH